MRTFIKVPAALVVVIALGLSACANMTSRQQRALSGGALGAAGGATIAALTGGGVVTGALIGGAGGGAIGALMSGNGHNHKPASP